VQTVRRCSPGSLRSADRQQQANGFSRYRPREPLWRWPTLLSKICLSTAADAYANAHTALVDLRDGLMATSSGASSIVFERPNFSAWARGGTRPPCARDWRRSQPTTGMR
jgi:hypothetical protein